MASECTFSAVPSDSDHGVQSGGRSSAPAAVATGGWLAELRSRSEAIETVGELKTSILISPALPTFYPPQKVKSFFFDRFAERSSSLRSAKGAE